MWEREYESDLLEYLDTKYHCALVVNVVNEFGIVKNKCTVELYLGDTEHQITIHNLERINSTEICKLEISLTNEHSARSLHEVLEEALTTNTDDKYIVYINTEMCLIEPIYLEISKDGELLYKCHVKNLQTIKEK